MKSIRVVKRQEREAKNNLVVADQIATAPRMTPEMVVKSWITTTRERRQAEIQRLMLDFKNTTQGKLCLVVSD